jgi:alpha/beta superfamily hydrolase
VEERLGLSIAAGLTLEARLAAPAGARAGLVVCHPHPLYGGDMENPVVVRAAEVAQEVGLATLRFNFRGVGASKGTHDNGTGEQDDIRAAIAALRSRLGPDKPLGLAGYSFGAWVSARLAATAPGLAALCLIAPPLAMLDFAAEIPPGLDVLVVAGTRDSYCPTAEFGRLAARLPPGKAVTIEGADHFFFGRMFPMGEAIRAWLIGWVPA